MKYGTWLIPVIALAMLSLGANGPALRSQGGHGSMVFFADLTGDEEVPMPVETDATGDAKFRVNPDRTQIDFRLRIRNAIDVLAGPGAHIHCAAVGENGPVVVFLAGGLPVGVDGTVRIEASLNDSNIVNPACGETIDELAQSMLMGQAYVNVHSAANPGGEIRGQIHPGGRGHGSDEDDDDDDDDE